MTAYGALRLPDPPLSDERVELRRLTAADAPALARAAADPDVRRLAHSDRVPLHDAHAARAFVEQQIPRLLATRSAVMLGVSPRCGSELLGAVALSNLDLDDGLGELGCWIAAGARDRGLGRSAARLLCAWGFDVLGLHRVQALTDPANERAERTLEALGFVCEGTLRGIERRRDGHHDCRCWSLLSSDRAVLERVPAAVRRPAAPAPRR